jgi:hypothetical protein
LGYDTHVPWCMPLKSTHRQHRKPLYEKYSIITACGFLKNMKYCSSYKRGVWLKNINLRRCCAAASSICHLCTILRTISYPLPVFFHRIDAKAPFSVDFVNSYLYSLWCFIPVYTLKKKVSDIPVPSRDVTYQTLPGRKL